MKQLTRASSWREHMIEIPGFSCKEYQFLDTNPNMFYVVNETKETIYFSTTTTPTNVKYEALCYPKKTAVFGKPFGTNNLFILNDSNHPIILKFWSYAGDFDISILKDFTINSDDIKFDGVIKGFQTGAKLPSGDNMIGFVGLRSEDFENFVELFEMLESKDYDNKLDEIKTMLSTINITLTSLTANKSQSLEWIKEFKGDITEELYILIPNGANLFSFVGDINENIVVSFYNNDTLTGKFTLEAGKNYSDISIINVTSLTLTRNNYDTEAHYQIIIQGVNES